MFKLPTQLYKLLQGHCAAAQPLPAERIAVLQARRAAATMTRYKQ
jgi:hypothetical protein